MAAGPGGVLRASALKQMKLKWLLQEMSGHIKYAMLRTVVFSSGCTAAALAFWAGGFLWLPVLGRGVHFCSPAFIQG